MWTGLVKMFVGASVHETYCKNSKYWVVVVVLLLLYCCCRSTVNIYGHVWTVS